MNKTKLTVVIPIYNEEKSLSELSKQIADALENYTLTCVYVDDASTDNSFNELLKIKKDTKKGKTIIIKFRKHLGKSAGLAVGFKFAKSALVATIDGDLQDNPYEIPKLIKKLDEGYDLVSGWRVDRHDNWGKKLPSKFFNTFVGFVVGIKIHDFNTGLKVYRESVVKELSLYGELHRYIPVLAVSRGFKVAELPVKHSKRKYGKSKYGIKRIFQAGFDFLATWLLITFKKRPMQFFGTTGATFLALGLLILTYLSILHFLGERIGDRPLLLFGILLVLFSVQLISTGFIAELVTSYHQQEENYPIDQVIK